MPAFRKWMELCFRSEGPRLGSILFRGAWLSGGALPATVGPVISRGNVGRGAFVNPGSFALQGHHGSLEEVSDGPCTSWRVSHAPVDDIRPWDGFALERL